MSIGRAGDHPPPAFQLLGQVTPIEPILIPVEPQPEALIAVGWRVCNSRLLYCESKQLSRGVGVSAFSPDSGTFYIPFSFFFYNRDSSKYYCYNGRMHWICARKRHYEEAINCLARSAIGPATSVYGCLWRWIVTEEWQP